MSVWGWQIEQDIQSSNYQKTVASVARQTTNLADNHKTWDLDGVNLMPDPRPRSEGSWQIPNTEQIINGGFANGNNWSSAQNISGGQLTKTGSGLVFQEVALLQAGSEYIITVDVDTIGAAVQLYVGGAASSNLALGQQTIFITAGSSNTFVGFNNGNSSTVINSISLVQNTITPESTT